MDAARPSESTRYRRHISLGMDTPAEVEAMEPRLHYLDTFPTSRLPEYPALSLHQRALATLADVVPGSRRFNRPVRFTFDGTDPT